MELEDAVVPPEDVEPVEEPTLAGDVGEPPYQEMRNPWPHLEEYFAFQSRDEKNVNILYFRCVLCQPKETTIRGHMTSLYNLKSHIKRNHYAHSIQFQERIKAGSCRGKHKHRHLSGSSASIRYSSQSQSPAKTLRQPDTGKALHVRLSVVGAQAGEEPLGQDTSGSASPPSAANAGLTGPYLLKKETHCTTVLDQLMRDDTYADVTLTAEGQSLRAHRIVLCLASSYFRQVLSRDMNVQSVIVLRDIKFAELRNIIHFIYTGEATVDASELESFMRTAELLEITSLCESQKCLTGRGNLPHNSFSSSFSIGDFEQLVGTKRSKKEQSSSPKKARRISGEGQSSSRCSSVEPAPTPNPIALIKEEPGYEPPAKVIKKQEKESLDKELLNTEPTNEGPSCTERLRRDSSGSVGSFAAIAGIQKTTGDADEGEGYSADGLTSSNSQEESMRRESPMAPLADTTAQPKRCPYCPHLSQTYEGVDMMRHLLVSHPCKPAFPCDVCCRVFVKRASYKAHQPHCHQSMT